MSMGNNRKDTRVRSGHATDSTTIDKSTHVANLTLLLRIMVSNMIDPTDGVSCVEGTGTWTWDKGAE